MASIYKTNSVWRAQVRLQGKPATSKLFPTKREAQVWAREEEERLAKSRSNDPNATFSDVLNVYRTLGNPGGRDKQRELNALERYWGDWRVSEIHTGSITAYVMKRKRDGAGPSTILTDLSYFGTVLGHGGVLAGNREAQVARLELKTAISSLYHTGAIASSVQRERRPTEQELLMLKAHWADRKRTKTPYWDIVVFAICTALRQGEIVGLGGIRFEHLDLANRTIWIKGRKDPRIPKGRDMLLPLPVGPVTIDKVVCDPVDMIKRQPGFHKSAGLIFPCSEACIANGFAYAVTACSIEDLRFHDLRHDAISRLFEAGWDIPKVAAVSGHRTWKNLARYTHIKPGFLQK